MNVLKLKWRVLTGFLYGKFIFLLCLPKYYCPFIYSVSCVKQNVAERKQREVQAVPAEMQIRNNSNYEQAAWINDHKRK